MNRLEAPDTTTAELAPGVRIPLIGLGTWPMTGQDATGAVTRALQNGYRHIDTAESYGNEDAVGEGLRRSGIPRAEVFLTTKINREWHSRDGVRTAAARAARRLGVDYLDLLLVHWPNPAQGQFVEACEGLQQLFRDGSIRAWGVSNFKPAQLEQVRAAGLEVPLNQVQLDPEHGQPAQLEYHRTHGILTAAYSPLGRNGSFLADPAVTGPAGKLGRTPAQIVLRWHVQQGRVAVPKSASDARQRENLDVFDFELTARQLDAITALDTGAGPRLDSDDYGH
ncbi:2,5-diketo-D-gluconate reductase A [Arthrobacter ginsengisoli]|uniref:2,5-diketo-D-gluconate reductase A n=1 Tax=Arthrobacter ginsengisoli TaxID=1356565 RepID=A0ABU1UBJ2_9MICC|nr:aldo/keto reductase [Arthrobacter ginsengisoli]MDR7082505.1 2,5-diketo-D-gluconate reductase A [Arthrobacter ginsengisoli]